ncbi:MAG: hypothetical protein ACTS80_01735 [Candidatus Hodgkinia cicadicola]
MLTADWDSEKVVEAQYLMLRSFPIRLHARERTKWTKFVKRRGNVSFLRLEV